MCFVYFFVSLLFAFETEGGGEERKLLCFLEYILLRLKKNLVHQLSKIILYQSELWI